MEKQDAPFSQILEYRNWIQRLQLEEEMGPLNSAHLDVLEIEAEEMELMERAEYLKMTLRVLEEEEEEATTKAEQVGGASTRLQRAEDDAGLDGGAGGRGHDRGDDEENLREAGRGGLQFDGVRADIAAEEDANARDVDGQAAGGVGAQKGGAEESDTLVMVNGRQTVRAAKRSDMDILRSKLRVVLDQLDTLRGMDVPVHAAGALGGDRRAERGAPPADTHSGRGADGSGVGKGDRGGGHAAIRERLAGVGAGGEGGGSGGVAKSVTAGLAAELGSKWGAHRVEPREGARIAAEGTLEDAPEPCMLAQGTIDTAQRLWKFGL